MQLRQFLPQFTQLRQHHTRICPLRQNQLPGQHRLQKRLPRLRLIAQSLAGIGFCKAGHGADLPGLRLLRRFIFLTVVQADLIYLLFPGILRLFRAGAQIGQQRFRFQDAAGDLQMCQPLSLRIPGNLEHPRAKLLRITLLQCIPIDCIQKLLHAGHPQGGAKKTGKQLPLPDQPADLSLRHLPGLKILLHGFLLAGGNILLAAFRSHIRKIHTAAIQTDLQL